ncbi:MAG TPA: alpha/beta hydrolase [Vicinamibacterales bacterium]|nr:alpha/beta hydrolase [Vicinamibacterales bacterium]
MKRFLTALLPVVGVILLVLAAIWFGQRGMIYFPDGHNPAPAAFGLPDAEPQTFDTEDGLTLGGWFLPARAGATGYTVIIFNGNAGHRGYRAGLAAQLAARGLSVFLFDYRGYGGNPGLPSETGLARDARAALAYLGRRPGVDLTRIVFFGESLGAAVAVRLALEYPPAALMLRSPFSSMIAIGSHHYPILPVRWLLRDRYPSIDRIPKITSPLLVVAGDADRIVPLADTQELFEAAPQPKRLVVIPGADHNDEELCEGPALLRAIVERVLGS